MKFHKLPRILIVDDEKDLCILLRSAILKSTDADIEMSNNVADAKLKIIKQEYDIVFFDYNLPDGTGAELVEYTIKHKKVAPHIIAMSADTNEEDVKHLRRIGVNYFMAKPLSFSKISQSIAPLIN